MKKKQKSVKMKQDKRHMVKKSDAKPEHKSQGQQAPTNHKLSGGDPFAYAIGGEKVTKGSQQGFLGVESELLNPIEYVKKDNLNVKKRSK